MNKGIHCFVTGRVQGVCFRMYTQRQAEDNGLTGWVRNLADGQVEVPAGAERIDADIKCAPIVANCSLRAMM